MDKLDINTALDIASRVGEDSFKSLGGLLLASKLCHTLASHPLVLNNVSLQPFLDDAALINEDSIYRPFFRHCLESRNPTAVYLESIRLVAKVGRSEDALYLLYTIGNSPPHAWFARALLEVCLGFYENALHTIDSFVSYIGSWRAADAVGSKVFRHIIQLGPVKIRSHEIVRRLSQHGFRELAPFVAAGPEGMALAFDVSVLQDVDIDEFVFAPHLANIGSLYRPFFLRCLDAANQSAHYVEGLRLAAQEGPCQRSIDLLGAAAPHILYARFALGIVLVCCGSFDQGMEVMQTFFNLVPNIEEAVETGEMVLHQVTSMRFPRSGRYDNSLRFGGGLPNCFINNFRVTSLCRRCFVFMYATRFQELC
ncbi:hypothetical protein ISN45_Aa06g037750 [Arabidopsis thaliana x Arabidopsis arenosa]|uniref:Uncharacterized protein n=1 Tax=Arabidopsis thaliana x Arabidopsis arenosa TaxID=1240361 RepID=A0A8T1Z373_9BRAS|nr:hypothetical protein ISN45_Aa06g037750 [Arabidopsis thaliana x Arabidopsis arenosa]